MNQYIGKTLGSYQILEQIGQGGMATIFKAYQPSMDRYVALKVLPRHFTEDETFVARFTQEARTLARLEHPHILPVHDYGEQQGITYLVMRYIDAGTLKDLISRQGSLELSQAARVLGQVGRALGYAHSQGVVHRDIKPANVMIDERGDVFLTDFGIAKLVAGTSQFTATGAIVGTPAYMSPEQGMAEPADHRSDIYALGVVLYEMVTGRAPFEAETPLAVLLQHVNAPLPPPRQVKPDLPDTVERVILKAMAKSPDDRFQSAEDMVEALQRAVDGIPTEIMLPRRPDKAVAPEFVSPRPSEPTLVAPAEPEAETVIAAPSPKPRPWLPIAGGVALLAVALVTALLILPNLGGEDEAPAGAPPTRDAPTGAAPTTPPKTVVKTATLPRGWTNYSNGDLVQTLALQGDYLWVGGSGGLVRWDLDDGSYVKFGVSDGLASSRVHDLLVDEEGGLWAATDAGINTLDGQTLRTFDESDGLGSDEVWSLFLDHDGALWAGTAYGERGLNLFDGTSWGPPSIPLLPVESPRLRAWAMEKNYGLWVGLDEHGLAYFDGDGWRMFGSGDGLPSDQVYDLLLTDDDELWASFEGGVVRRDPETGEWEIVSRLEGRNAYAIHQASDGSLWFGGEDGVARYTPQTDGWQWFETGSDDIPSWAVTGIVENEAGLWFGTFDGGVVFYDGDGWETWATGDELGGNDVIAISQDGSGAVWLIHDGDGLSRYDPSDDEWQTFGEDDGVTDWPSAPGVDGAGRLWIGSYGTLWRYDERGWQSFAPPELADIEIYRIAFGPDDVQWLSTDAGLLRHDPATDEWLELNAADHPLLEAMETFHAASDGALWVGGEQGLIRYDGSEWNAPAASGAPTEYVNDIAEAPDGSLWVVADNELYHLEGDQWTWLGWPETGWLEVVVVGPDGIVWVGYQGGVGRFDPRNGERRVFTSADGLVSHEVQAMYVTREGEVWIGTAGGVSRYAPQE